VYYYDIMSVDLLSWLYCRPPTELSVVSAKFMPLELNSTWFDCIRRTVCVWLVRHVSVAVQCI